MLNPDLEHAIETCLDPDEMRAYLQPLLAPQGSIEAVYIAKAHRSASRRRDPHPLLAVYEVQLRDAATLPVRTVRCYGKVCRAGIGAHAPSAAATRAMSVPALQMLLWAFPADAGLPQLPRLLDAGATRPFWRRPAQSVEVLRYEPECRATLRYTGARGETLYAKTFSDGRGEAIHRRFGWFWERSQEDRLAPCVARPLHYAVAERTLWQEAASGQPLREWMDARGDAWIMPLAHAIATLHGAPHELADPQTQDTAHWLIEAKRRRQKIVRVLPAQAGRANVTLAAIEQAEARLPACVPVPIHGDFHLDQVWFDGERIVLFDFDEFVLGDPMQDLAAFLVRLPGEDGSMAQWVAAYAGIAPRHFCGVRLRWHLAVQQLVRASRAFVFQGPGWRAEVERRLEAAEAFALQARSECAP
jgi:hypothetical protein